MNRSLPIIIAFLMDFLIGDPEGRLHPVALIGKLIAFFEYYLINKGSARVIKKILGTVFVLFVIGIVAIIASVGFYLSAMIIYGQIIFSVLCVWAAISPRSLAQTGKKVADLIEKNKLDEARAGLSALVGRDTTALDKPGIAAAAVESIAENTVDGVIAPLFYAVIGGPVLALIYRSVNTMDSMVGYKNERYLDFGWAAARLDDILNLIPARLTRYLIVLAAAVIGKNWLKALKVSAVEGGNHPSPNSGIPEATMAGALKIRLGGPAFYEGRLRGREFIGYGGLPDASSIRQAIKLELVSSVIFIAVLSIAMLI